MKTRGFEVISMYQDKKVNLPKRQTKASAGYDLESCEAITLLPGEVKLVPTGLKAYMLDDEVLQIYIRSSLASKRGLIMVNSVGIIDADYYNNKTNEGHILLAIKNISTTTQLINKHERIAQGIFMKYLTVDNEKKPNEERIGGFGSSNKGK